MHLLKLWRQSEFRCLSRISKVNQFLRALLTGRINYLTFKQILYLAYRSQNCQSITSETLVSGLLSIVGRGLLISSTVYSCSATAADWLCKQRGTWAYTLKASVWSRSSWSLCVQLIVLLFIQQIACSDQAFRLWSAARSKRSGKICRKRGGILSLSLTPYPTPSLFFLLTSLARRSPQSEHLEQAIGL